MNVVTGNALDLVAKTGGFLLHQVNCQRVAGAGIALQIRKRWPDWFANFEATDGELGDAYIVPVALRPAISVVNLYAQYGYGRGQRHTDYGAFEHALQGCAPTLQAANGQPTYVPWGIGCGLAGGEWPIIRSLLERYLPFAILVQLP